MIKELGMVREFHQKGELPLDKPINLPDFYLRVQVMAEEFKEVLYACETVADHLTREEINNYELDAACEELLKELGDVLYVIFGTTESFGWDLQEAFKRIHESNMSKQVDGKFQKNEIGKIVKGPNYQKPSMEGLINASC